MHSSPQSNTISPNKSLSRRDFFALLLAACEANEWRYARRLATAWLASFPGDLPVKLQLAQAIVHDEHFTSPRQAWTILDELCALDPEYSAAHALLSSLNHNENQEARFITKGCVLALSTSIKQMASKGEMAPIWARQLQEARSSLAKYISGDHGALEKAEHAIHQALIENPETPLAAVTHLNIMSAKPELPSSAILSLAQIYHARWPNCLQFSLVLADRLMDSGDSTQAVELLHLVVAKDITGQVVKRLWGTEHPYHALWPDIIEIEPTIINNPQSMPIPAKVAGRLGMNQLPANAHEFSTPTQPSIIDIPTDTHTTPSTVVFTKNSPQDTTQLKIKTIPVPRNKSGKKLSEPTRAVQTEFTKLARQLKTPAIAEQDGRFPVYVIYTTRTGLEKQYGAQGAAVLDEEMKKLARAIRGQRINNQLWGAILLYADDPEYTSFFDLQPAPYNDPWGLKLLLTDLDSALGKGGEKIGAVLIVGGPQVVPFHHLPNPVDDADTEVLSDNPYASSGENYFVSEWPIGRLPGSNSHDPIGLVTLLRSTTHRYLVNRRIQPWYRKILSRVREFILHKRKHLQSSFGYTAAVWRRASLAVFRIIGNPQELLVSPPVRSCDQDINGTTLTPSTEAETEHSTCLIIPGTHLAYFNLHGIPDSAYWYGHRDPTEPLPGVEFPVAIRPEDVRNGGSAPQLVFSEACYGAHILEKSIEDALSLKFLESGSQAVIGSTCISYGSISTPLSAADLLGRIFWSLLEDGLQAGEALRRAKLHLVREMHRRQGYLDPEDQKTIISFVLYGDPLAQPFRAIGRSKRVYRYNELPTEIHTVTENPQSLESTHPISPEIVAQVKSIVAQYLPGMTGAQLHLTQTQVDLTDLKPNGSGKSYQVQTSMLSLAGRRVVSLSKNIQQASLNHTQFARLTMDESGKLIKLTVSR